MAMHFDVKGWSPKIDRDIFEEPENIPILWSGFFVQNVFF